VGVTATARLERVKVGLDVDGLFRPRRGGSCVGDLAGDRAGQERNRAADEAGLDALLEG
jgi:hypothetical protein